MSHLPVRLLAPIIRQEQDDSIEKMVRCYYLVSASEEGCINKNKILLKKIC